MRSRRFLRIAPILAALVVAGLVALTYSIYRRDIHRAYERISTGSQIAETRCGPIEYATAGEGPPVLSVHGAGGGFDQGLEIAEPLARAGYRVIAMSRFGYLRTPLPPDASAAAQADAHACLLDALNIQRAAVVGTSAGGPSSLQFALRYPDRTAALVLIVPAAYAPRPNEAPSVVTPPGVPFLFQSALRSDFLFWAMGRVAGNIFIRGILGTPPEVVERADADEQARVRRIREHILPIGPRQQGLINDAVVCSALPRYELEQISAPTLAISAADDLYGTFDGARYTAEHVRHGRFVGYPSGGHMLVGHDAEAKSEVAAFLEESATF
jgi:pimeloyl-ACP methyl ester carboxylesterase